jgi:hypothetical protein
MPDYLVHLSRYVEQVAQVKVTADDPGAALAAARQMGTSKLYWRDGEGKMSVNYQSAEPVVVDWEAVARRAGWDEVEGAPFPLTPGPVPESHLFHRNLDRVWPAGDWEGAARDLGIGDDGTYGDESAAV